MKFFSSPPPRGERPKDFLEWLWNWIFWFWGPIRSWDVVLWKTNDCQPGEWTQESIQRFNSLIRHFREYGPYHIVLSGGLPDRDGKTISDAIRRRMERLLPEASLWVLGEEDRLSQDTSQEITFVAPIFKRYCRTHRGARFFILSNFWHLQRLMVMCWFQRISARKIVSPTSGGVKYKLSRFLNEFMLLFISFIDPRYDFFIFKAERKRRAKIARNSSLPI